MSGLRGKCGCENVVLRDGGRCDGGDDVVVDE